MTAATAAASGAEASAAAAVSVRELTVRFDADAGGITALNRVGFEVPEGGFVTMLGPSGCGKSTLLRAIADLVPISGGAIGVFGRTPGEARRARWNEITRDKLNEELLRIWGETGTTIMFVTHSVPEAAFLGQRCLVLTAQPGRVREYVDVGFAEPRSLAMRDTLEFVQVTAHLRSLPEEAR